MRMPRTFKYVTLPALKLLYRVFFGALIRDPTWRGALFELIPQGGRKRLLQFGPGSDSLALDMAGRLPDISIIAADPNRLAVERTRHAIAKNRIPNLAVIGATRHEHLSLEAASFDIVTLILTLHNCPPEEKLFIAKEAFRALRRGGVLLVADYDKPLLPREGMILKIGRHISGAPAITPHLDGSWIRCFDKAGFRAIHRKSSHSVAVGRISMLMARRP